MYHKQTIQRQTERRYILKRIYAGILFIKDNKLAKLCFLFCFLLCFIAVSLNALVPLQEAGLLDSLKRSLSNLLYFIMLLFSLLALCLLFGTPIGANEIRIQLQKAGLVNYVGEAPILISTRPVEDNPRITRWEFDSCGISLETWEAQVPMIETALNITIAHLQYANGKQNILLFSVPANNDLPDLIRWKKEYLSSESFVLLLGEGITGTVIVNLSKIPHILLGGSTGSGKSQLLKLLLMQALHKGAKIYIADFKGGVDYSAIWHKNCFMCFDPDKLNFLLTELVEKLQKRKILFTESGSANLDDYNTKNNEQIPRYIFACDEIAEILDKTGLTKEQKEKVLQIESKLSIIARQGRAFGIHLILATQRPDATILSGQIRNNIDCRICGRADNVLSQIILDSTLAADKIPKNSMGRFILYDGTVFQAYLMDDSDLEA